VSSIPSSTDDAVWKTVEYLDIPMAGQVIFDPRDFATLITNARVRGVYSGSDVAVMLEWTDKQQNKGDDNLPPDAAHIQFPTKTTEGAKPYLFMGDKKLGVNVWQWKASDDAGPEYAAAGPDTVTPQEKQAVKVVATYTDGQYRVLFSRALDTRDEKHTLFEVGKFMPFSVALYDGRNNEQGKKAAISAWYYMILEPPTPLKTYVLPPLLFLVFLGIGLLLHKQLRKTGKTEK